MKFALMPVMPWRRPTKFSQMKATKAAKVKRRLSKIKQSAEGILIREKNKNRGLTNEQDSV